ncbi:MAG: patatin-like phospholipase family protein [Gammaproteobacteria bacterium]|nr:patatin-like phospholipase family protein [Gammaproteobacteria bacterium]MBU1603477.1 patatin-like phospholipase family protein [Gammaproteobacteria bacterium]MBU2432997.1 patatin-like phospholipase family protein [Gammaproteobacteria bacterium]MBU2450240.1 patatin-like phospholipase family protein [Gammaproteobacteria bacterium]
MNPPPASAGKTALVLTGGGARAAYQVGVMLAVAKLSTNRRKNPFPILCGTSAGAINAAGIACLADNFGKAVSVLASFWRNMHAGDIYRADPVGIGLKGAHWMTMLTLGWLIRSRPRSLLDNSPLRELLSRHLDFRGIERSIANGALHALSISASGYESGDNINFFQGHADAQPWHRVQRIGIRSEIGVDHLLASSAIPFIFPATKIHREFFGDGSMRQLAPISPAIHLGAERVLIVGAGRKNEHQERRRVDSHPSLAQIAGHALSSIFLDSLAVDIERMQRINRTLAAIPSEVRENNEIPLRPIKALIISPSERIERIAAEHAGSLPWAMRTMLGGIGGMNRRNGTLTSYLLFEKPYTRALIDLGYADTMARSDEVGEFLDL